ncbi:MAG: NAD(P)-binding domain-containing protein [Pseudomonadota bacterium]
MTDNNESVLAIIGGGQLANYFLAGLRQSGDSRRVVLSPHNRAKAEDLATRYSCEIASDNQSAVDQADLVLLATRPDVAEAALQALELHDAQTVVSVVAGIGLDRLEPLAAPARVVRSLPVCCAEVGTGGMPQFPADARVTGLLSTMGRVVVMDDEASFDTMAVTGCAIIWFAQMIAELQKWLQANGVAESQARSMALLTAQGASGLPLAKPDLPVQALVDSIARDGTFTLIGMDILREQGGFDALHSACDNILGRFQAANN